MPAFRKQLTLFDDYHDMLSDGVRMQAYRRAIEAVVQPNDVVVDLGAGTGIMSLIAARAGAAHVYAIEQSDAIDLARRTASANGLADRITFVQGVSREVTLPVRANVLLSETLGSFGLDENTLEFTMDARDRFLRPQARLLPCGLQTFVAPVELAAHRRKIAFWREIEGFDFSPACEDLSGRMSLARVGARDLVAEPQLFSEHNLATVSDCEVASTLYFGVQRRAIIDGFAGWFCADLGAGISIRTSPSDALTHWQQAFFPLREAVHVVGGDIVELRLRVTPRRDHSDNTEITYDYRCTQIDDDPGERPAAARITST
ncbi:MAG: 50S ribosomal protein L11 methyltransferase [Nannocystaceae bacterium]